MSDYEKERSFSLLTMILIILILSGIILFLYKSERIFLSPEENYGAGNYGAGVYSSGESTALTECRVLNLANRVYTLTASFTAASDPCFQITADNVTFDGGNYLITAMVDGRTVYSGANNSVIRNLNVAGGARGIDLNAGSSNVLAYDNFINNSNLQGIFITGGSQNNTIRDNVIQNSNDKGIQIDTASGGNTIRNNNIFNNRGYGLQVLADNNYLEGNNVNNNLNTGIYVHNSDNSTIINNNVSSNSDIGIDIETSTNTNILNSTISGNSRGITISPSNNGILSGNKIISQTGYGVILYTTSTNNLFVNNNIQGNTVLDINDLTTGISPNYLDYNNSLGAVRWINQGFLENLTTKGDLTFPGNITIGNNSVLFNANGFTGSINSDMNITLYGIRTNFVNPTIFRNGVNCPSNICVNFTSLNAGTVKFSVTEEGNYSIVSADAIPPSSVSDLRNVSAGYTWIYWNWTNPSDSDFAGNRIMINGIFAVFTFNHYYNATNLTQNTSHTIIINTLDSNGNLNNANVSNSAKTLSYYCGDEICNGGESCSLCSNDCGICSGTSGFESGGSGGGTTTGGTKYVLTDVQVNSGYTNSLGKNDKLEFEIKSINTGIREKHTLTVNKVETNSAEIVIASSPITAILRVGEQRKFNITSSSYDLSVKLESIANGKARLTIKSVAEVPSMPSAQKEQPLPIIKKETAQPSKKEANIIYPIIGLMISLLVIGILIVIFLLFKRMRKQKEDNLEFARRYVREAYNKGYGDDDLKNVFKNNGWSEEDIKKIFQR